MIEKDKQMAKLIEKIIDDRPKLAVMTERDETKHHLHVYKRDDCYKFVRAQKRNLSQAPKRVPPGYELVIQRKNIPNGVNVLNYCTKELLLRGSYKSCYNNIRTNIDVPSLVKDLLSTV